MCNSVAPRVTAIFGSTGGLQGGIGFTKDLEIFSTFVAAPLPPSPHLFTEVPPGSVSGAGFGVGFRRPALGRFRGGFWCWSGGAFLATRLWLDLGWVGRGGLGAGRLRGALRTHLHGAGSGRGTPRRRVHRAPRGWVETKRHPGGGVRPSELGARAFIIPGLLAKISLDTSTLH